MSNLKHQWYQPYSWVQHYYCRRCGIVKKGSRGVKCKYPAWKLEEEKDEG